MVALAWGAGWLLFKWVRACLPATSRSADLDLHLLADVAVVVAAFTALWAARVHHAGSLHGGVATVGYVPRARLAWQLRYLANWALPFVFVHLACWCAVALAEWGTPQTPLDFAIGGLRATADALLLIAVATLVTATPARWVGDVAMALAVVVLWRGHLLFPVTSSHPVGEPLFGDIPAAALADKGLYRSEWGPIAATTFLAAALLSLWSCQGAPRAANDRTAR